MFSLILDSETTHQRLKEGRHKKGERWVGLLASHVM